MVRNGLLLIEIAVKVQNSRELADAENSDFGGVFGGNVLRRVRPEAANVYHSNSIECRGVRAANSNL
eukprot:COSAG02_NODE_248_length_27133_cov_45.131723_26_plen_67_part_00